MENKYIILNPIFFLKPDIGRALIAIKDMGRGLDDNVFYPISPVYARILAFIDGSKMNVLCDKISQETSFNRSSIYNFLINLIDKETFQLKEYKGYTSIFPPKLILSSSKPFEKPFRKYNPLDFDSSKLDLSNKRHCTPTTLTLMLTTKCYTNCFYCYADKRRNIDCSIPFKRICELIDESIHAKVKNIEIIGGEIFLYKKWYSLLNKLYSVGYNPYISTKMPIHAKIISQLKELGVNDIQLSIDSLKTNSLKDILQIGGNYSDKIKNTIQLLDNNEIKIYIHSILTHKNQTIDDISSLYDFIKNIKNVVRWKLDIADEPFFMNSKHSVKPGMDSIKIINDYLNGINVNKGNLDLIYNLDPKKDNGKNGMNKQVNSFFARGSCSGNYTSLFILPDGKVTLCEQLYWNPVFILGDVKEQGILDIWNSQKARDMYNLKQSLIPPDSLCHTCDKFVECRSEKQVCYREIVKYIGADKWYYPDMNCPYFKNDNRYVIKGYAKPW